MSRDQELESYKQQNLSLYAAHCGYVLDRRRTTKNMAVMKHPSGHKIVVFKGHDSHWVYWSVNSASVKDKGSIIDFVMNRCNVTLGGARHILRKFVPQSDFTLEGYLPRIEPLSRNLGAVRAAYEATEDLPFGQHNYLNVVRKIPASLLSLPIFAGRVRIDHRSNAVFPHFDRDGVCGLVLKNNAFSGLFPGSKKGLWCTRAQPGDTLLCIAEAAIDGISYAALFRNQAIRIISTGGAMNDEQPDLITSAIQKLPSGEVVIARDHDEGGAAFSSRIAECFNRAGRTDLSLRDHPPDQPGYDWNNVLMEQSP